MGLYPLDLIATITLAGAQIFYNRLPTRFYHVPYFIRPLVFAGCVWFFIALLVPYSVGHFFFAFGVLTLGSAWQIHRGHLLRGKMWLAGSSSLAASVGAIFILAETFEIYPSNLSGQVQFILEAYLGAAPIGLAIVLFIFTRRAATEAQLPLGLAHFYARLLLTLTLLRGAVRIFSQYVNFMMPPHPSLGGAAGLTNGAVTLLILPGLAYLAMRRIVSPTPSRSGSILLAVAALGVCSEVAFDWISGQ